jgi:hypothetical protein
VTLGFNPRIKPAESAAALAAEGRSFGHFPRKTAFFRKLFSPRGMFLFNFTQSRAFFSKLLTRAVNGLE